MIDRIKRGLTFVCMATVILGMHVALIAEKLANERKQQRGKK